AAAGPYLRILRYDTQAPFNSSGSWSTFDDATLNPTAVSFRGAAFDGRSFYMVPWSPFAPSALVRFDTRSSFDARGTWDAFDLSTVHPGVAGFSGATFDGRYLY